MKPEKPKYEELGSYLLSYDIAITCLLEAVAKENAATGRAIALAIRDALTRVDDKKFPGVREKSELYARLCDQTYTPTVQ